MKKLTPMMKQYMSVKNQYKDCIVFFRLGDFYEMFYEDAVVASRELEITLTKRGAGSANEIPMCGVPHHVSDSYITKLVARGYKVAICDQVEDAKDAVGLVKRDVIRVVTPGTITEQGSLDEKSNNFLASIYMDDLGWGISYVDNSTGEIYTTEYVGGKTEASTFLIDELGKVFPSEIICNEGFKSNNNVIKIVENTIDPYINVFYNKEYVEKDLKDSVLKHFKSNSKKSLGIEDKIYSIIATGKLIEYLYSTQKNTLDHINKLNFYEAKNYMILDINTRMNLEIHETIIKRDKKGALIGILDKTSTSMGGRLLKKWLEQPLLDIVEIESRNNAIEYFVSNVVDKDEVEKILKQIYDIERLATKISNGNCNARDFISLKNSIILLPELKRILINIDNGEINKLGNAIDTLEDIHKLLEDSIKEEPPITITEGGLIKKGYNEKLDEIKEICVNGKEWLSKLEAKEREKTAIRNLKIGYNRIYGYYFEVTKANIPNVPDYFIRKQTLTNSERYYTEELKAMESEIIGAEEKSLDLEHKIFQEIRENVKNQILRLQNTSKTISNIDVINSLAKVAYSHDFVKPKLNNNGSIEIIDGRHPVVENNIENNLFVPNDTHLNNKDNMIQIITGPNMAGKSTYMRQVAIITLLAQIGSFVPASYADISIVDRIFTRIGAADNLSQGESTFMVEMNEVSNIIRSATKNSLIILDEVGRGTSTYDGLSIAWAVVEYIESNIKAKTLFATHYHELTKLESKDNGIKNLTITVQEKDNEIIFLRKIVEGSTNESYGIEVAKLAGIDSMIINRANEVLELIEGNRKINLTDTRVKESKQINLMDHQKNYYIDRIIDIDIDNITAKEALDILYELKETGMKIRRDPNE